MQWRQLKGGCIAIADLIHPTASANPADVLPPPPPAAPTQLEQTTLKKEGVTLSGAHMTKMEQLAKERDAQLKVETSTEAWRDLFDRARCLFREAALPNNVSRLLTRIFSTRRVPANHCESVIARVLVKA